MKMKTLCVMLGASLVLAACNGDDRSDSPTVEPETPKKTVEFSVSLSNLTLAQPMSPVAVVVADATWSVFELGESSSTELEYISEGGNNSFLLSAANASDAAIVSASGSGAVGPANSGTVMVSFSEDDLDKAYLSAVTMLVNTNDAITAVQGVKLSDIAVGESYSTRAVAYDAGTEANTEAVGTIPGPADGGEGFNSERNDLDVVTIHPGVISMDDGLSSSVLTQVHRFDNPVAGFTVTRIK